jgi:hypothetical protein
MRFLTGALSTRAAREWRRRAGVEAGAFCAERAPDFDSARTRARRFPLGVGGRDGGRRVYARRRAGYMRRRRRQRVRGGGGATEDDAPGRAPTADGGCLAQSAFFRSSATRVPNPERSQPLGAAHPPPACTLAPPIDAMHPPSPSPPPPLSPALEPNRRRRTFSHPDAFDSVTLPPANESAPERAARVQREREERAVSDNIDAQLVRDRQHARKHREIKVLLLGQSESGKSTTLKRESLSSWCALDRAVDNGVRDI